jgi:hypothetical protein
MNVATLQAKDNAIAPRLYMAMELSNKIWKLVFSDGVKRRRLPMTATSMESAEGMASCKMPRAETMPEEVVSPIMIVVVNSSDHKIVVVERSVRIVRTEATDVRAIIRTRNKGITSASTEQKNCSCGD